MARVSMAALLDRTRTMISDIGSPTITPDGTFADTDTTRVFTDDWIQNALDSRRMEIRFQLLQSRPTYQPGGGVLYLDYYSDHTDWEDDVLLQDGNWSTVTPSVAEPIVGHWAFAAQPQGYSVHATGKVYDLYGSSADLLDQWAARLKLQVGYSVGAVRQSMQQQYAQLRSLAAEYRMRARPQQSYLHQTEAASTYGGASVVYPAPNAGSF